MSRQDGFSLIEMAMVLIVVGILISLGAGMVGPLTKRVRFNESRDILNAAVESVNSWSAGNSRLPDWSGTGNPADFRNVVRSPDDAFTRPLVYAFDNNLASAGAPSTICGRRSVLITIVTDSGNTISNVAFVVVSGGDDNTIDTTIGTNALTSGAISSATSINADTANDIVKWVTIDELRTKAGCLGAQLSITNTELSQAFRCSAYAGVIYAAGGVPFSSGGQYRWCIQNNSGLAPAGVTFRNHTGTTDIPFSTNCAGLAEASWVQADYINLGGAPNSAGNYAVTFHARDNNDPAGTNDSQTRKNFVLTVGAGDNRFRVWNNAGATYDFLLSSKGICSTAANGSEITEPSSNMFLNPGDSIIRYSSVNGSCTTLQATYYFADSVAGDTNCNFQVNLSGAVVTDR